jgi:AcrR family transcriptional regulator
MANAKWPKETWTRAAMNAIARGGISAVSVDALAAQLGATRGSFYWHFKDRDALLTAAIAAWEGTDTVQVEARLADIADAKRRMRTLFREIAFNEASDEVPGLEAAIFAQPDHPLIAPVLRRVTERRLQILAAGFKDLGLSPAKARRQAVLVYATYVGWLQLRRTAGHLVPEVAAEGRDARLAVDHLVDQLIPA